MILGEEYSNVDIWAFGVVIFILLTGKKPFSQWEDDKNTLRSIREDMQLWP
jgi:serine/threonine protein kinase